MIFAFLNFSNKFNCLEDSFGDGASSTPAKGSLADKLLLVAIESSLTRFVASAGDSVGENCGSSTVAIACGPESDSLVKVSIGAACNMSAKSGSLTAAISMDTELNFSLSEVFFVTSDCLAEVE